MSVLITKREFSLCCVLKKRQKLSDEYVKLSAAMFFRSISCLVYSRKTCKSIVKKQVIRFVQHCVEVFFRKYYTKNILRSKVVKIQVCMFLRKVFTHVLNL